MPLFSSLRSRASSSDEKDHDSDSENNNNNHNDDDNDNNNNNNEPLLLSPSNNSPSSARERGTTSLLLPDIGNNNNNGDDSTFPLRIKLNNGKATVDFTLESVLPNVTVRKLKERILARHFGDDDDDATAAGGGGIDGSKNEAGTTIHPSLQSPSRRGTKTTINSNTNNNNNNRYLRLIVRGRMMAPDTSRLETFSIAANDVIHAVLAKEGVRGGQQARMLRRMNHDGSGSGSSARGNGIGGGNGANNTATGSTTTTTLAASSSSADQTLWRRIGIDANGVVISNNNNENGEDDDDDDSDEDSSEAGSEFEDAHGEIDLEMGGNNNGSSIRGGGGEGGTTTTTTTLRQRRQEGGGRRRRRRERRGFDRLRSTGMTRDEVTAIRLYFARSVDRYIERRRVMIRASRRLRDSLIDIVNTGVSGRGGSLSSSGAGAGVGSPSRRRADTGESTNSLLEQDESSNNVNDDGGEEGMDDIELGDNVRDGGNDASATTNGSSGGANTDGSNAERSTNESSFEGEEILNDRRRMEDEWMSTQGPYSEFRMNLNTNNPLLLAAITGGGNGVGGSAAATTTTPAPTTPAGLFFRSRNGGLSDLGVGADEDDDEMFGGAFTPNGTFLRNGGANSPYHPYMGPLPSAGSDKDFVWGFILGFFVGFIMLFWVWMPTVPHKQKIGIMSGISFQLGLNLLRKNGQGPGVAI